MSLRIIVKQVMNLVEHSLNACVTLVNSKRQVKGFFPITHDNYNTYFLSCLFWLAHFCKPSTIIIMFPGDMVFQCIQVVFQLLISMLHVVIMKLAILCVSVCQCSSGVLCTIYPYLLIQVSQSRLCVCTCVRVYVCVVCVCYAFYVPYILICLHKYHRADCVCVCTCVCVCVCVMH